MHSTILFIFLLMLEVFQLMQIKDHRFNVDFYFLCYRFE